MAAIVAVLLASVYGFPLRAQNSVLHTLVIDPGHGGIDPGAVSKVIPGLQEKDVVLDISLRLRDSLHCSLPDLNVVLTRSTDTFIELNKRADIARQAHADFFLSIHANADESGNGFGSETFILGINAENEKNAAWVRENRSILFEENYETLYAAFAPGSPERIMLFELVSGAFREESFSFAELLEQTYVTSVARKSRGVKQAFFIVLCQSGVPAVLTEVGFVSNAGDAALLASPEGRGRIAGALCRAIVAYRKGQPAATVQVQSDH